MRLLHLWKWLTPATRLRAALFVVAVLLSAFGNARANASYDLTQFSIEELMHIEVVSVAKKEQSLFGAAAAVFVVTGEDMRRAGVTSIPQALRLVPGVQVGRQDANKWAVSARGFNDISSPA